MIALNAPAKINWSIYVLNKRSDGYHNILSLMHCIDLCDTISFDHADRIELKTDMDIPLEQNLVYKAAVMLQSFADIKKGAKIILKKTIPSGAGLGGGSSDVACTLKGLNMLWGLGFSNNELKSIGSRLGSDVPFFFDCPIAIAEGRGEILTPLSIDISYYLLLIKPSISISTAWAYENMRPRISHSTAVQLTKTEDKLNNIKLIFEDLRLGNILNLKPSICNDFEDIVLKKYPEIMDLKDMLLRAGASAALMSGSGSVVYGVFLKKDEAVSAAKHFTSYWHSIAETLTTARCG